MKNELALHMCYWSGTEIGNDLDQIISFTAKTGADRLELGPDVFLNLNKQQRKDLLCRIEDQGLSVSVNGGLMNERNDTSSPDPAIRKVGIEHCRRVLEACADMKSPYWSGLMHSAWCLKPDLEDPQECKRRTWARSVEAMKTVSQIASDYGVVCAIEIVNRYEHFLLNTAEDGIVFCEEVGSPYCKLCLDVFHMSIEENHMPSAIEAAQNHGRLACVHLGETNRRIPTGGPTNIDWGSFGKAVQNCGYSGAMVFEPLQFSKASTAAKTCLWRNVADSDDLSGLVENARKAVCPAAVEGHNAYECHSFWENICQLLKETAARMLERGASPKELRGIAVASMGEMGFPVGKKDAIFPAISWYDLCSVRYWEQLCDRISLERQVKITGQKIIHIFSVAKLMWLKAEHPRIYDEMDTWLCIADYVSFKLCGSRCMEKSLATRTGLLDYRTDTWSDEILKMAGIDSEKLPCLVHGGERLGEVTIQAANDTGLPPGLPVFHIQIPRPYALHDLSQERCR